MGRGSISVSRSDSECCGQTQTKRATAFVGLINVAAGRRAISCQEIKVQNIAHAKTGGPTFTKFLAEGRIQTDGWVFVNIRSESSDEHQPLAGEVGADSEGGPRSRML